VREIKFRVWDHQHKEMMFENPSRLWVQRDGTLCFGKTFGKERSGGDFDWKQWDELKFEVQQLTGLKDKTDKDIYEGDIIKYYRLFEKDKNIKGLLSVIEFKNGGFRFDLKGFNEYNTQLNDQEEVEVLGNIFENPELLE